MHLKLPRANAIKLAFLCVTQGYRNTEAFLFGNAFWADSLSSKGINDYSTLNILAMDSKDEFVQEAMTYTGLRRLPQTSKLPQPGNASWVIRIKLRSWRKALWIPHNALILNEIWIHLCWNHDISLHQPTLHKALNELLLNAPPHPSSTAL